MRLKNLQVCVFHFIATLILFSVTSLSAADKIRVAYVSPSVSQSLPWFAKELGILSKYDLIAEVLLMPAARGAVTDRR